LVAGIPPDLDALCLDLLRRRPEERPSGQEILQRLSGLSGEMAKPGNIKTADVRTMPLVGREKHFAALREAFQKTREGRAAIVFVKGRSGMGKSMLTRRFLDEIHQSKLNAIILSGRCFEQESVPYKALDSLTDALSQYLKRLPRAEAESLLPEDIQALARVFPVLQQVQAVAGAAQKVLEIPDSQELRRRAFAAFRELLNRLAKKAPLVLAIDDLQWGDVDSAILLGEILSPPDEPPLLLIGSIRSEEAELSPLLKILNETTEDWPTPPSQLAVEELSADEATGLALMLLGDESETAKTRAQLIAKESGGSPFFIDEFVRYAQSAQGVDMWTDRSGEFAPAITLYDVVQARVSQLPEEARRLFEIVIVAGQPLERAIARQAGKIYSIEQAISLLRAGHLIRARRSKHHFEIEPYHNRIQETLAPHIDPELLKSHHLALALALEEHDRSDPQRLSWHYINAGNFLKAAQYAEIAAQQAVDTLAFDLAAQLYFMALEIYSDIEGEKSKQLNSLRIKLGDALVNAGRGKEGAKFYLAAASYALAENERRLCIELQQRAAEQFLRAGIIDEGMTVLNNVLANVALKMPTSPRRALISMLLQHALTRLRGLNFNERPAAQVPSEELLRIDTCWSASIGLGLVDVVRSADFQSRHLRFALKAGEPHRIARALSTEIAYCATAGNRSHQRTIKLIKMARDLAERLNDPKTLAFTTFTEGVAAFLEGDWKKAHELSDLAETMLRERCTGVTWELDSTHIFALRPLYYLGDFNKIASRFPVLLKEAQERGDLYAETNLLTRISYLVSLAADKTDHIQDELRSALGRWSYEGFFVQHCWKLVGQVETALYCGGYKGAYHLLVESWPSLKKSLLMRVQFILVEMHFLRARAALALATISQEKKALIATAESDAARIERETLSWAQPLAQLIRASIAALRGDQSSALSFLKAAEIGFQAANMPLYENAARYQHGLLLADREGERLMEAAENWMQNQQIKNPALMSNMVAPGKWARG
jgi:hypothetical protein